MNEDQVLSALGAMSQETRLRILRFLITRGETGASAGDIAEAAGAAPSRASFHLSTLQNAGLLLSTRESRNIIYRANFPALGGLLNYLLEDCCMNHPDIMGCCEKVP